MNWKGDSGILPLVDSDEDITSAQGKYDKDANEIEERKEIQSSHQLVDEVCQGKG